MTGDPGFESLQCRTLAAFLALHSQPTVWPGKLLLLDDLDEAAPLALAGLAAGAAVLWTARDADSFRTAAQSGWTDFSVSTLSEAIRILKNEIRKSLPVSVGVLDADLKVWPEIVSRGLQPDALLAGRKAAAAAGVLVRRGAVPFTAVRFTTEDLVSDAAESWRDRRTLDAQWLGATEHLPEEQRPVAGRWFAAAPHLFPRDLRRWHHPAWSASNQDR